MNVMIGTAPVNWNNRDVPDYRPHTPYLQMLDEMAAAGYEGTEYGAEFPDDPQQVKRDLAARNLKLASMFCPVNLRDRERWDTEISRAEDIAKRLAALGGDMIIIADSGDADRIAVAGRAEEGPQLTPAQWEALIEGLHLLADRCAQHGVRVAFHNHVGTYVETEAELSRLMEGTDPARVGLCYDVGHMLYAGGDVYGFMEAYRDRIIYMHLKDVDMAVLQRARREKLSFHDALREIIFPELGTGGLDVGRVIHLLRDSGYSGWIIVEQDTTRRTPLESARRNREYLRTHFGL